MQYTREEMIVKNLPLVTFVVGKMANETASSPIDREDAISYGIEGLIHAVDNYDETRGVTFASFAIRRIRGSILDAIRRVDVLPRSLRRSVRDFERTNLELASMLGRWPTMKELALRMNLSVDKVRTIGGHVGSRVMSLEMIMGDSSPDGPPQWEAMDRNELTDPAAAADYKATLQLLAPALHTLSERDQEIVLLRYGQSLPFHEIGRLMNLSESRVFQLHKQILSNLQARLKREFGIAA